ncbi:Uncharacterised protein [Bordetella pertussis]|nr:Uncharacterised protein [Bordetella pertussis]
MSTMNSAPLSWAMRAMRSKSMCSAYAEAPATISLGLCSLVSRSTWA